MRTARILLVEPEESVRRELDWHLELAGHEVASVARADDARVLLEDGLDPDVVVAASGPSAEETLRTLAPRAALLRLRADSDGRAEERASEDKVSCSRDPGDVLRRIEEVLLDSPSLPDGDTALRCVDLVRRLASSLSRARTAEDRCNLLAETFDAYYGVLGSLVIRRGPQPDDCVEVAQGLDWSLAKVVSEELLRRTAGRGLRPFLTRLSHEGRSHEIAGMPIEFGPQETDLVLLLSRPPEEPALRESLMSLVGNELRSAMVSDELDRTRASLDGQTRSFSSLLEMSRDFTKVGSRGLLGEAILRALNRELSMSRSALFLRRAPGDAMLAPQASSGMVPELLERIGLSPQYGVGAACFAARRVLRLSSLPHEGVAARELQRLGEAGLSWGVALRSDERPIGLLFFGSDDDVSDLDVREMQALDALLEAAGVSLRNLERVEELRDIALGTLQGLVAAAELRRPEDKGHAERVARGSIALGRALGLPPRELRDLAVSALLHDIGKLVIPYEASGDPDSRRMRMHPVLGTRILSRAKPTPAVVRGVEQHHERWDGHGFPYGLHGEDIHPFARIVAVADAHDRWAHEEGEDAPERALRRLELAAGLLFDPGLTALYAAEIGRAAPSPDSSTDGWLEEIMAAP